MVRPVTENRPGRCGMETCRGGTGRCAAWTGNYRRLRTTFLSPRRFGEAK